MAAEEEETRHLVEPPRYSTAGAKKTVARKVRALRRNRLNPPNQGGGNAYIALSTSAAPAVEDYNAGRLDAPDPWPLPCEAAAKGNRARGLFAPLPCLPPPAYEEDTKASTGLHKEDNKASTGLQGTKARTGGARAPRRLCGWLPLPSFNSPFPRPDVVDEDPFRSSLPGPLEQLALNRKLVMDCLDLYNSLHPDDEYEPAPGVVTQYSSFAGGFFWVHGNFVARRKRSGCFSFFPAPRTIFFFELVTREGFDGVATCVPLDEPVTEAYSFLGIPLGWRTRRDGCADHICKTCYSRCEIPRGPRKPFLCGHEQDKAEIVCEMCYLRSCVLHPYPGEFAFGYRKRRNTYS